MNLLDDELLFESSEDILLSVMKEAGINDPSDMDLLNSKAYVMLHRDNPDTKEILGSYNILVPYALNSDLKSSINEMNVPAQSPVLTCFGMFDASQSNLDDMSIRCTIRNEHGYPLSHMSDELIDKTEGINARISQVIRNEIIEDLEKSRQVQET
jgi:hypothetical protein